MKHLAQFNLIYPAGDPKVPETLEEIKRQIALIPAAKQVTLYRQVDPRNHFKYCVEVLFDSEEGLDEYNKHELHDSFVQDLWTKVVKEANVLNITDVDVY